MNLQTRITTIQHGHMDERFAPIEQVKVNRDKAYGEAKSQLTVVRMNALHGDKAVPITAGNVSLFRRAEYDLGRPECDALITDQFDVALEGNPADCGMYTLCNEQLGILGLVHAGRAGSISRILEKTIDKTIATFALDRDEYISGLRVTMAPAICANCFRDGYGEIPREDYSLWKDYIRGEHGGAASNGILRLVPRNDEKKIGLDLAGFNKSRLLAIGVPESQIQINPICTYESPDYFSHRRADNEGAENGRILVSAWMSK